MVSSVHWYGHVLWREDGHALRVVLEFEDKVEDRRERPEMTVKIQVEEYMKNWLDLERCAFRSGWVFYGNQIEVNLSMLNCCGYYRTKHWSLSCWTQIAWIHLNGVAVEVSSRTPLLMVILVGLSSHKFCYQRSMVST